jgi:DNA invertase Pin-like site-specific DNA recombinase
MASAGIDKIYSDIGWSGASKQRPQLTAALNSLQPGDTLVVWKLDRAARSVAHLIKIIERLEAQGVGFKSLTENIDTSSASGKLILHIFAAFAQFERDLIRERTIAGMMSAARKGKHPGQRAKFNNFKRLELRVLQRDETLTIGQLAARLNMGRSTLHRWLAKDKKQRAEFVREGLPIPEAYQ